LDSQAEVTVADTIVDAFPLRMSGITTRPGAEVPGRAQNFGPIRLREKEKRSQTGSMVGCNGNVIRPAHIPRQTFSANGVCLGWAVCRCKHNSSSGSNPVSSESLRSDSSPSWYPVHPARLQTSPALWGRFCESQVAPHLARTGAGNGPLSLAVLCSFRTSRRKELAPWVGAFRRFQISSRVQAVRLCQRQRSEGWRSAPNRARHL
jgi:hypothetical protein